MSIFYKSDSRDENALSHWFLAIYQRLSCEARSFLLKNCGLRLLPDMGDPISVENQVQLGKRRPDGMIRFSDMAIAFENKVKAVHEDGSEDDLSQLKYYYTQLNEEFLLKKEFRPRLLVAADGTIQNREQILLLIREQGIPEDHVDIMTWQEVHHACVKSLEIWNSDISSDLDRFLVKELKILLEEMRMESFTGIKLEDIEGYARSWRALSALEEFLKVEVPKEFSMLKPYGLGHWGSIHQVYLGFGFLAEWDHAWLYVGMLRRDEVLKIAIKLDNNQSTSKLMKTEVMEELVPVLEAAEGFEVRLGPGKRSVDLAKRLQEYRSGNLGTIDFFEGYLSVERRYPFKELQDDIGLDSPMFPENLIVEISKLKRIASIINKGLIGNA